jgi:propionyl-CoA synthetase
LIGLGLTKGDRVIIYMPMIIETAIAMLACARIGLIHSKVFGGFSSAELHSRILDSDAKMIVSASCGLEPHKVVDYP